MKLSKKLCFILLLNPLFVHTADRTPNLDIPAESSSISIFSRASMERAFGSIKEKLPAISCTDDQKIVLKNASVILASLCSSFGNVVGRLCLMGFFTFKTCKHIHALFSDNTARSEHAAKTVCYAMTTILLAQDGYAWLLRQEV